MDWRARVGTVAAVCLFGGTAAAQAPELVLHGGTQEVLLDFVVRDKRQREVKDIRPEEVEILEDGVPQKQKSFEYRSGRDAAGSGAVGGASGREPGKAVKLDPLREINLVTLVFAGMGPLSRQQAAAMAHDFLRAEPGPNTWIGVFTLNYRFAAIQPYTTDLALLNKAVDRAATGQYQQFAQETLELVQRINSAEPNAKMYLQKFGLPGSTDQKSLPPNPAQFQPLQPGSAQDFVRGGDPAANAALADLDRATLRLLLKHEGSRTVDALHDLIRAQAAIPGRKTVLLFSEGLAIPPEQPELLEPVISEANRANLTFYTLDARGLSTVSNSKLSTLMHEAIQGSYMQTNDGGPSVLATDLQANARHLASGTGGFAMDSSNDLRSPLRRVMEDVRSHYEVAYAPASTNYDGHFRKLTVRLTRPGLTVQSRAGYYALPMVAGEALEPFEMAALRILDVQPEPHALRFEAGALRFGPAADGHVYRVVIAIPSAALGLREDVARHTVGIHVSALALIKDRQGQVLQKLSKDLEYQVPEEKRAELQAGDTTVILPVDLAGGVYHLETAVLDRVAEKAGAHRSVIAAPEAPAGIEAGDFVWVRRVQAAGERDLLNPLDTAAGRMVPAFNPVFAKGEVAHFYFMVHVPAGRGQARWEAAIARDGQPVTTVRLEAPERNPDGSYGYMESFPTEPFAPGQYDIQVKSGAQVLGSQFAVR